MKRTTCEIHFENNPTKVVTAGQLVRGTVQMSLSKDTNVRCIYIILYGEGYYSYNLGIGRNQKIVTDDEIYLDKRTYFVDGRNEEIQLSSGIHNFNFEFNLRKNSPTSLETELAYIRYAASVIFDVPLWPSKTFMEPFTVIKPFDLNIVPILRKPINCERTDNYTGLNWFCWFYSNPMKISIRIPHGGYSCGQIINCELNINNQSGQPIGCVLTKLVRKVTLKHTNSNQQRTETSIIAKTKTQEGCDRYQNKIIHANIKVPETAPTDLTSSKIIKINYIVRLIVTTSSYWCNDGIFNIPITIGTHPIQDIVTENMAPIQSISAIVSDNTISQDPSTIEGDAPSPNCPPPFPNDELPTYEELQNKISMFKPRFKRSASISSDLM